jgi:hypothetical protein
MQFLFLHLEFWTKVVAKKKVGNQIDYLIPNH